MIMKAVLLVVLFSAVAFAAVVLPNTRISDVVKADHRQLEVLANSYASASNAVVKRDIIIRIINLLETHDRLEDLLLYPVVRERVRNGVVLADKAQLDHQQVKNTMVNLKRGHVDEDVLRKVVDESVAHAKWEEVEILPILEETIGSAESNNIANRWVVENQRVMQSVMMEMFPEQLPEQMPEQTEGSEDDNATDAEGHFGRFGFGFGFPGFYGGFGFGYPGFGFPYPDPGFGFPYPDPGFGFPYGGFGYGIPYYGFGYPSGYGMPWW